MDKRLFRIFLILCLLSLAGQLVLYPRLPARVPTTWGLDGQVSNWGSPLIILFFAVLPLLDLLLMRALPTLDPRGQSYKRSPRAVNAITGGTVGALLVLSWLFMLPALGAQIPADKAIMVAVGVMFVVLGNFMPQLRPNFFIGVRSPWALSDDTVWRKTQRAAGFAFCTGGIVFIITAFLPRGWWLVIPVVLVLAATTGVWGFSFIIYRRQQRSQSPK